MDETQKQILDLQLANALHLKKLLGLFQDAVTAKSSSSKTVKSKTSKDSDNAPTPKPDLTDKQVKKPNPADGFKLYFSSVSDFFKKIIKAPGDGKKSTEPVNKISTSDIVKSITTNLSKKEQPKLAADQREQFREAQLVSFDQSTRLFLTDLVKSIKIGKDVEDVDITSKVEKTSWWKTLIRPLTLFLGGIAGLIFGLMSDGPLKGFLKLIAQGGISAWLKTIGAVISLKFKLLKAALGKFIDIKHLDDIIKGIGDKVKGFFTPVTDFIFKTVPKFLDKLIQPIAKTLGITSKSFSFKSIAAIVAKALPNLKFIPVIGSLISFGFAASRYIKGDVIGGTIDLVSGILNLVAPLTGPAAPILVGLSIGLSVLNAVLDYKAGGAAGPGIQAKKANILGGWLKRVGSAVLMMSPLAPLFAATKAIYDISTGKDVRKSLIELAYMFPFAGTLAGWMGQPKTPEEAYEKISSSGFLDKITGLIAKLPPFTTISNIVTGIKLASQGKWLLAAKAFGSALPFVSSLIYFAEQQSDSPDKISDIIKPSFVDDLISKALGSIKTFIGKIPEYISGFIDKIGKPVLNILLQPFTASKDLFKNIRNIVSKIIDSVVSILPENITGIGKTVYDNVKSGFIKLFIEIPSQIASKLSQLASNIKTFIQDGIKSAGNQFITLLPKEFLDAITKTLPRSFTSVLSIAKNKISNLFKSITEALKTSPIEFGKDVIDNIINLPKQVTNIIIEKINTFWKNTLNVVGSIQNFITNTPLKVENVFETIISKITGFIKNTTTNIFNKLTEIKVTGIEVWNYITDSLSTSIKKLVDRFIPTDNEDKKFSLKEYIFDHISTFVKGVIDLKDSIVPAAGLLWNKIVTATAEVGESVKPFVTDIFNSIKTVFTGIIDNIVGITKKVPQLVDTFWSKITETFDSIVTSLLKKVPFIGNKIKAENERPTIVSSTLATVGQSDLFEVVTYIKDIRDTLNTINKTTSDLNSKIQSRSAVPPVDRPMPYISDVVTRDIPAADLNIGNRDVRPEPHVSTNPTSVKETPTLVRVMQPVQEKGATGSSELLKAAKSSSDSQLKMIEELRNGEMVRLLSSINNILKESSNNRTGPIVVTGSGGINNAILPSGNSAAYNLRNKQRGSR